MKPQKPVRWFDHLLGLLLGCAYVALLVKTSHTLGYARDEGFYFGAAESYSQWFQLLFTHAKDAFLPANIDRYWGVNHEHPALVKSAFALSWTLFFKKWHLFAEEGTAFRFPGMLSAAVVMWVLYIWGTRARSRLTGAAAALGFALMPRVFYHAHLACFDIPIVAAWLLCAYAYWRSLQGGGWRWALMTGLLFGLALDTKHNSWFLPIAFTAHALWRLLVQWREVKGRPTLNIPLALPAMALLGPLVFYALWPWIWHDTAARLEGYVAFHTGHEYYNMEFLGQNYWKPPMPRAYAPVMTAATVPFVTLLSALLGMVTWAREKVPGWRAMPDRACTGVLWALAIAINYAAWLSPETPIFGGTKHWMTAYPFLALFAGVGFDWTVQKAKEAGPRWLAKPALAASVIGALCVASPLVQTLRSHPFGLSNYTPLVGGAAGGATLGLNRGFWGFTTGSLVPWLNANAKKGASVYLHDTAGQSWDMLMRDHRLRSDLRAAWSPADADYAIYHHEPHMEGVEYQYWVVYETTAPLYIPLYDGVPVVWLYGEKGP